MTKKYYYIDEIEKNKKKYLLCTDNYFEFCKVIDSLGTHKKLQSQKSYIKNFLYNPDNILLNDIEIKNLCIFDKKDIMHVYNIGVFYDNNYLVD